MRMTFYADLAVERSTSEGFFGVFFTGTEIFLVFRVMSVIALHGSSEMLTAIDFSLNTFYMELRNKPHTVYEKIKLFTL